MSRILVVYFSRTGTTGRVAEQVAQALHGEACAITEASSRLGPLGYVRSLWEASTGRDATIQPLRCDPSEADLLVIGTPIWGWHLSSPVRSFVRRHRAAMRHCAFFCTQGGSGSEAAFAELRQLAGQAPLATLALSDAEVADGSGRAKFDAFVATLREASE